MFKLFKKKKEILVSCPYAFAKKEVKRLSKETKKPWTADIIIWDDGDFQITIFHSHTPDNPFDSLKGIKRDRYISHNDFNLTYYPSDGYLFK